MRESNGYETPTCELSTDEHVAAIIDGSVVTGVGLGCLGGYLALRELAYALEQIHGYVPESFVPTDLSIILIEAGLKEKHEQQEQADAMERVSGGISVDQDGDPRVH